MDLTELEKLRRKILDYGLTFEGAYEDMPFREVNWKLVRYKDNKKAFLWTYVKDGYVNLNVKTDPDRAYFWRSIHKSVLPGYHQNKDHWSTIVLDGTVPTEDVKQMIEESYALISYSPSKRIYEAVKKIPYGKVATYAQVAQMAGDRKMARAVGNALHKNPDPAHIPCYRVVNAKGELAGEFAFGGPGQQAKLLEKEGIVVNNGKVDLKQYQMEDEV
ncbi:MAG: methylated-DNA--[protein]-cysteine S-methyltransferase [Lachnospiraceae bacterium]|nr:methylated-DNA--[protein]-cysteine S-methyltransferase [Lachnospiraceae bacterium]